MPTTRTLAALALTLAATGLAAACSTSQPAAGPTVSFTQPDRTANVCASHGLPGSPDGTRGPDELCADNTDPDPVWVWYAVTNGTPVPGVGRPIPTQTLTTARVQPSGSAQQRMNPANPADTEEVEDAKVGVTGGVAQQTPVDAEEEEQAAQQAEQASEEASQQAAEESEEETSNAASEEAEESTSISSVSEE